MNNFIHNVTGVCGMLVIFDGGIGNILYGALMVYLANKWKNEPE